MLYFSSAELVGGVENCRFMAALDARCARTHYKAVVLVRVGTSQ